MATGIKERYLMGEQGNRVAVALDIAEYDRILAELEELQDIRAFDAAKASGEKPIPIRQALAETERKRASK